MTRPWHKTARVLECLDRLGVHTPESLRLPVIEVPLARHEEIDAVGRFLFEKGIYVTLAAYPLVPKSEVGFRIQMTAANTDAEIDSSSTSSGELASASTCSQPTRAAGARMTPCPRSAVAPPDLGLVPRRRGLADGGLSLRRRRSRATVR